jgi:hypothetical protein
MTLTCSKCSKALSRKRARLIDAKLLCSACLFPETKAGLPRDRDGTEGGDAKAAPGPQPCHARAEGIAQPPSGEAA